MSRAGIGVACLAVGIGVGYMGSEVRHTMQERQAAAATSTTHAPETGRNLPTTSTIATGAGSSATETTVTIAPVTTTSEAPKAIIFPHTYHRPSMGAEGDITCSNAGNPVSIGAAEEGSMGYSALKGFAHANPNAKDAIYGAFEVPTDAESLALQVASLNGIDSLVTNPNNFPTTDSLGRLLVFGGDCKDANGMVIVP